MFDRLDRYAAMSSRCCAWLAGLVALTSVMVLAANIVLRLVGTPFVGAVELVSYGMLATIVLALPWTHRQQAHIRITMLTERLRPGPRAGTEVLAQGLTLIATAVIAVAYGVRTVAGESFPVTGLLDVPEEPFRVLVVVGFGLWGVEALCGLIRAVPRGTGEAAR